MAAARSRHRARAMRLGPGAGRRSKRRAAGCRRQRRSNRRPADRSCADADRDRDGMTAGIAALDRVPAPGPEPACDGFRGFLGQLSGQACELFGLIRFRAGSWMPLWRGLSAWLDRRSCVAASLRHGRLAARERWCRRRGLNSRPSVYKTAALPLCYAGSGAAVPVRRGEGKGRGGRAERKKPRHEGGARQPAGPADRKSISGRRSGCRDPWSRARRACR